uniref:Truncated protein kinase n=1 Tax=Enterococcus faecium TaxID=1352 RepID=Q8KSE3_ENTFC|nr:truncated protein kinase [Enterococcus faecium]
MVIKLKNKKTTIPN